MLSFTIMSQKPHLLFFLWFFFCLSPQMNIPTQLGADLSSHSRAELQPILYSQIFLHIWKHPTTYKMSSCGSIPVTSMFSQQLFVLTGRIEFPTIRKAFMAVYCLLMKSCARTSLTLQQWNFILSQAHHSYCFPFRTTQL